MPQHTSDTPNRALSPTIRMSVACRISVPPAIAGPSTAAMRGLSRRNPLSSGLMTPAATSATVVSPDREPSPRSVVAAPSPFSAAANASPGAESDIVCRSAPAQNAPPAPVRTTTRTSGSALASSQAPAMPRIISSDNAFRRSGRFMVTTMTCLSRSTSRCPSSPPDAMVEVEHILVCPTTGRRLRSRAPQFSPDPSRPSPAGPAVPRPPAGGRHQWARRARAARPASRARWSRRDPVGRTSRRSCA